MNLLVSKLRIREIADSVQIYKNYLKEQVKHEDLTYDDQNFNIEVNNVNFC